MMRGFPVLLAVMATSCAGAMNNAQMTMDARGATPGAARRVESAVNRSARTNPLTMKLSAYVTSEPGEITVRMRVEPDERSRSLTVEWWNVEGSGGSHLISLEGDRAAIRHDYAIKHAGAGEYTISAILKRNDGSEVIKQRTLMVVGEGQTFDRVRHPGLGPTADVD